jgi:hypothetical protein
MAVMACLGRANYWTSLPFLGLMVILIVFGLIWPEKLPNMGESRWSPLAIRLWLGFVLILVLAFFVPASLREARNDPNCDHPGTAMEQGPPGDRSHLAHAEQVVAVPGPGQDAPVPALG